MEAISERSPPNDPTLDQLLTFHLRSVAVHRQYGEDLASQQMVVGPNGPKTGIPFLLRPRMNLLFEEIRRNPLLWLLAFVPVVFVAHKIKPEAHTLLFVLSVLAIVPLAALLSHATESVAGQDGRYRRWSAQRHAG